MKLTKFVHSCLLVESNGRRILTDPGNFSWASGLVTADILQNIDAVVVTHNHPDHLDNDFAKAIHAASPDALWYGPQQVVTQLETLGIVARTESDDEDIRFIESHHADLSPWLNQQPEHSSYVLFGDVLVGGDCHTLTSSHGARIFAAAINGGPWGAVLGFIHMIEAMPDRPEIVVPLHDWHFNDEARTSIYARLPEVLAPLEVTFMPLQNGVSVDV